MTETTPGTRETTPAVGQAAPDFELRDQHGRPVRLSSFRGRKNVLLVFYPHAFTPTCTGEMHDLRSEGFEFTDDLALLAVSCDPSASLRVFGEQLGIDYHLLSDFWPHGEVARAYGVFDESFGFALRGSFIIDRQGVVRWSIVNGPGEARSTADYEKALAELLDEG
jgi:peroxiredoxin